MDAQYAIPSTYHIHTPEAAFIYAPDFAFTYNTPSPEFTAHREPFQYTQHTQHAIQRTQQQQQQHTLSNHYNHNHTHYPSRNHSRSPRLGLGVSDWDSDFADSLRSIRGTGSRARAQASPGPAHGLGLGRGTAEVPGPVEGPTQSEAVVAETIVRARKSWKTVKGRSEPVWPPHLEKALVQALLQYKPHDARYTRALGRFPKRNRYISDFIFAATGVRRSPKQVGSRLQQLKDVSCGKMLLNHVASWSQAPSPSAPSPSNLPLPLQPQPDLDVILNDIYAQGHGSEGSQSPITPLGGTDPRSGACFAPSPASPAAALALDPYATITHTHMPVPVPVHLGFAPANAGWFTYDQCLPMPIPSQVLS